MRKTERSSLLEEIIRLLVHHFGVDRVRHAVEKLSGRSSQSRGAVASNAASRVRQPSLPTVVNALGLIRESDPEKHRLLDQFYNNLRNREILPESQDIRHFAQRIGLKQIKGKSRKDMIPTLMRFLIERPTERLRIDLPTADNISEKERQRGFSVLADKLLNGK